MLLSRRVVLSALPAGVPAARAREPRPKIGCQTNAWPINAQDFSQFLSVLERIKTFEYQGFETTFRNLRGQFREPRAARRGIEKTGLEFLGVHIFLTQYDPETAIAPWDLVTEVAEGGARLGARRLILSARGLTQGGRMDGEALKRKAAALNRAAELCRKHKLGLAYHNHDVEFSSGGAEMEQLLQLTDPAGMRLMLDAGHAFSAGADVLAFFRKHRARIDGIHLRDFRNGKQVPLGQGDFDLPALAAALRAAGWSGWLVNEEERPNDVRPGDSVVAPARQCVRKVFGL